MEISIMSYIAMGIAGVFVILAVFLVWILLSSAKEQDELAKSFYEAAKSNISAEAKVISTELDHFVTPSLSAKDAVFKMDLEVTVPGQSAYVIDANSVIRSEHRMFHVPIRFMDLLKKKGEILPVLVHPTIPTLVVFDEGRLDKLLQE